MDAAEEAKDDVLPPHPQDEEPPASFDSDDESPEEDDDDDDEHFLDDINPLFGGEGRYEYIDDVFVWFPVLLGATTLCKRSTWPSKAITRRTSPPPR